MGWFRAPVSRQQRSWSRGTVTGHRHTWPMTNKRTHRPRKVPKGDHGYRPSAAPLNLTGREDPAEELARLKAQASRAGVSELLEISDEGFATAPRQNIMAARQLVSARKLGAVAIADPAAVFDLAHLAMVERFGLDPSDVTLRPEGEQLAWLVDLCRRCGVDVDGEDGRIVFGAAADRMEQYQAVSLIAVKRLAMLQIEHW